MAVSTNLVAALSAVTAAVSLNGPVLLMVLAVVLVCYALPQVLRHRLHAKAVEKAEPADLPALFRAFKPNETEPDPPDSTGP
ncbi:hypothetical protein G3I76_10120 [Streptomyces sp. SID11233]|nr:hypothetical protein [Streptomyces sp. SID11233]